MTEAEKLRALRREERVALCREVLERLSELVEGEAPEDFCQRVDEILGDCRPFHTYQDTLRATIELLAGMRDELPAGTDDDGYSRCIERARSELGID